MYNLSKPQKLIYDMEKYAGGAVAVICGSMIVKGTKSLTELKEGVNELYRLNDAFRMRIVETNSGVRQVVNEFAPYNAEVLRFPSRDELDLYGANWAKEPMDLYGPLCETKIVLLSDSYGLLVKQHHIIADAWTLSLMGTQFNAILSGETPAAYSYIEYLGREEAYIQSNRCAKDRAFFLEQFKECDEVTYLSEKQNSSLQSNRKTFVIKGEQANKVTTYTKEHGASPFVLFMTVLAAYMSRTRMNVEKFYIGTAVLNRTGVQEKNTAGMFINTVPVLMELDNSASFAENLSKVKKSSFSVFRHQKYNYGDVLTDIRKEYGFAEKLYDVMFSYQNATITGADGAMESTWYHSGSQAENLQVHIDDRDCEGIFRIHYDYQVEKFSEAEIEQMHQRITSLLLDAVANDGKKLCELEILPETEKRTLLVDFNDTAVDYPRDKCIHTLFEEQAERTPDKTAVIACDCTLTYRELNEQANRIAHSLIEMGIGIGDIVVFALPRRSYLIAAMFGILKAGAAYLPVDPDYPQDRIDYMLQDSQAKLFITEENIFGLLKNDHTDNPAVPVNGSDPFCALHTSGSTGTPKISLLKRSGIRNWFFANRYVWDGVDAAVSATILTFDAFMIESILTLAHGCKVIFASENDIFNQTDFEKLFDYSHQNLFFSTPTKLKNYIDNSLTKKFVQNIKSFIVGGEIFDDFLFSSIKSNAPQCRVYNCYGPTETSICSTIKDVENIDITIGKPIANTQIYIVDQNMQLVPIGVTGELCIAGDGVGAGYLNRPELTAEKFVDNPFGKGKLYKTGDLAYWREDGNIVYVGRNDFQVKIRGLRIELGEIESTISSVRGVSQAVVVVRKDDTGRQLICAFYTENAPVAVGEIKAAIQEKLPRYMMPHSFTLLPQMPLTPSGKVNRKGLPEVDLSAIASTVEYVAPKTEQQKVLASAIEVVLGIERVGIEDNFFDLGGDSLKAIELIAKLEQKGYRTETRTVFGCGTVRKLAEQLTEVHTEEASAHFTGDIPATPAQLRVYTAQSVDGGLTTYNIPYIFKTTGVDTDRLQKAVSELIDRHEILRTHFENKDGAIIQLVEEHIPFEVEQVADSDIPAFIRPFDLAKAPLFRVGCAGNTVIVDMHHIVTDGGSMPIFFRELNELYMGRQMEVAPVQYRQFAMQKNDYTESEQYWLSVFDDELSELELNTDYKRKEHRSFNGNALYDSIDLSLHQKILQKCKALNITPYVFYMGGFNILLSKFSGNEDLVVGMPISGRESRYLNTIGMFVNTIALRSRPIGTKSVKTYLNEVKDASIRAITHQNYPYGELVKKLNANTTGRNPLFDVMFAYQSEAMTQVIFGDQKAELLPTPITTSKYDFTFNIMPMESSIAVMVEYCTDLYQESTVQRLIDGYRLALAQMLDDSTLLKDISAMSAQERHRLLVEYNDTAMDYPRDKCVHTLFEEQAAQTPEKIAVIACDCTLTYRELNEQANYIAHSLIKMGIGSGDIVAFALPRRSYLIATMFGILKTGAAYLPVDPDYPQDRIDYMLQDSQAKLFITEENILGLLKNDHADNPVFAQASESLCYCIYTSGTTGKPKGTLISHRNVVNFVQSNDVSNFQKNILNCCDYFVAANSVSFDITLQEIHLPLLNGRSSIMLSDEQVYNIGQSVHLLKGKRCGLIITPTKLGVYMADQAFCDSLHDIAFIMCGAESFPQQLRQQIRKYTNAMIFNGYGPTETTCGVLYSNTEDGTDITIGKPIANTQIYIVDRNMQLVPIGVTGELCIAGDGVGAGYLNRPELTAEKFVDNPFGKGKLYKTGDLAYWREDGNIVYVGRNDFQVKIRGLRIELGEIESTISSVSSVSQAVVVVRKDDTGRQMICAFYTENAPVAVGEMKAAIQEKLPRYMMPHSFTLLPQMPLTPSGKVNRKGLPEVDFSAITSAVEYIAPQTPTEEKLSTIWGELLKIDRVSRTDDFFELGGDSLLSISLLSKLESSFDVVVSIKDIFEHPVLEQLAVFIDRAQGHQEKIVALGAQRYTLLPQQLAIYAVCNKDPQTLAYNMPARIEWNESIDKERLKACIRRLFELHPELKTSIHSDEGVVYAAFDADAQVTFEEYTEQNAQDFVRPFNLSKAPLLRVGFTETAMLFDTHHIIVDGESVNIILRDLAELYQGGIPQKPEFSYADYASHFQTADFEEHKAYFKSMLKCDFEPLALPEKKNPSNAEGISLFYQIEEATFEKGRQIARANKMTDTMVFLGAFGILLSKYTARTDILSSVVVTNRVHKEVQGITGMFVNTLPVMLHVEGTTADYLAYVRDLMLNLYKYQELPFFEAAEAVGMNDKNVVNTSFVYQADGAKQVTIGNTQLTPAWIDTHTTKFDLTVELTPNENSCTIRIEYNSGKYEKALIDRLFEGYLRVIDQLGKEELKDISVLSDGEYQKVIYDFNDTAVEYPRDKCVHTLFEEQATKMPDKVALVFENKQFTYRQLNEMSNSLAHFLREKGVGRNDIVSIIAKRSWHIIVAMLGILKAGGAYMPVDPAYPKGRIEYMLDTAQCRIALTFGYEESLGIETVLLDSFDFMAQTAPVGNVNRSEDFCYIIFTSGSTGKPKGVSICHQNVLNYCDNNDNNVCCSIIEANHQSIVSVTNIIFDIFVTESLLPLLNGITIYFANDEQVFSQDGLGQLVEANAVDVMQTTPTKMRSYIMDKQNVAYLKTLKAIILGGEALPADLYQELRTYTTARIFNIYGPAETTVWSTNKKMEGDDITIGKPIANTQVYILDRHHQPLPIGVAGELCISGDGVGKGYLNRPELTTEKFIPNPFLSGKTMYCTGDLARWRTDGEIEYLGRIDTQVKIRGLRIELGEIESVMSSFDGIGLTAVTDKLDKTGRQYLVGYFTAYSAIDEKVLRQHLSTKLPKYMVPNYFVRLDKMPMTPSGKTDRKNLPMPEFASQAREYIPPNTEQEKMLCNMLSKLFNMESVGITDDFFELGGDSLRAIEYTAKAHHAGISFSLQNVFDYPTVESLCKYLQARPSKETIFTAEQFQKYAPILQKNTWNPVFIPQRCEMGNVLLTGATGFLGAHILDALMKHGIKKIYCLVRGSEEKLLQRLNYYFGEQYANSVGTSIIPVIGDLEDESVTGSLPERVGYVIHAAASVKHYGSWQYFKSANVDGTKRIVTYAKKVGARLIHISTISVSGNAGADQMELYVSEEEKHFYESSLYIDQPLNNVYIRSKFEAEMLVLDAMLEGLQANIIRVGNLTNRKSDLKFQPNYAENAFLTRVKAMLSLGCLPDYLMPLYSEFSPVDSTAEAIVTIAEHMNDQYTIFHANSNQNLYFDRMLEYLDRPARPMKVVSGEQFVKRIRDTIDSQQSYVYEALSNDLDEEDQLQYDTHIHIENEFTVQYLKSLGFQWPEIDYAYVEGYLRYFTQLGYFEGIGGEMSNR